MKFEIKRSNGYGDIVMLSTDGQKHHSHKIAFALLTLLNKLHPPKPDNTGKLPVKRVGDAET
jgi:hypothetical protein